MTRQFYVQRSKIKGGQISTFRPVNPADSASLARRVHKTPMIGMAKIAKSGRGGCKVMMLASSEAAFEAALLAKGWERVEKPTPGSALLDAILSASPKYLPPMKNTFKATEKYAYALMMKGKKIKPTKMAPEFLPEAGQE